MSVRYIFNPLSAELDVIDEPIIEEEMYVVNSSLESNRTIQLVYAEKEKSERIIVNGIELSRGSGRDYDIMNGIINFNPGTIVEGDNIKIVYLRRY